MVNSNLTYQKQAYGFIKSQIMNLGFKPGEYITDSQIAGLLKISRTPVREAFYRLEKEGLLINEARRYQRGCGRDGRTQGSCVPG